MKGKIQCQVCNKFKENVKPHRHTYMSYNGEVERDVMACKSCRKSFSFMKFNLSDLY